MKTRRPPSLAFRFLASILGVTLLVLTLAMALLQVEFQRSTQQLKELAQNALTVERHESEALQGRALETKAELLGRFMARTAPDILLTFDLDLIGRYQREAASDPDIAYAVYLDTDGRPMVPYEASPKDAIENRYPVEVDGEKLGEVLIGLDPKGLVAAKQVAGTRIAEAIDDARHLGETGQQRFLATLAVVSLALLVLLTLLFRYMFLRQVIRPLNDTTALIHELAQGEGDLSRRLPVRDQGEIDRLRAAVNDFMEKLQDMVGTIVQDTQALSSVATSLSTAAVTLVDDMDTERSHTQQVTTGVDQMATTIKQVALNTTQAAAAAREGETKALDGKAVVSSAMQDIQTLSAEVGTAAEVIGRLEEASGRIGSVLDVIVVISNQTNLLALNAAIEAARAGQHGRGFAVVADEVRSLAVRTQESTLEVRDIVAQVRSGTQAAIAAMERSLTQASASVAQSAKATAALEAILQAVRTINTMSNEIAAAADEQAKVAELVNQQVTIIDGLSAKTALSAQTAQSTSGNLMELASHLDTLVGRFRI